MTSPGWNTRRGSTSSSSRSARDQVAASAADSTRIRCPSRTGAQTTTASIRSSRRRLAASRVSTSRADSRRAAVAAKTSRPSRAARGTVASTSSPPMCGEPVASRPAAPTASPTAAIRSALRSIGPAGSGRGRRSRARAPSSPGSRDRPGRPPGGCPDAVGSAALGGSTALGRSTGGRASGRAGRSGTARNGSDGTAGEASTWSAWAVRRSRSGCRRMNTARSASSSPTAAARWATLTTRMSGLWVTAPAPAPSRPIIRSAPCWPRRRSAARRTHG